MSPILEKLAPPKNAIIKAVGNHWVTLVAPIIFFLFTWGICIMLFVLSRDIYETDYEEILYLNRGIRFYTEQSISLSEFFEDIVSISVVVINPAGKKFKLKEEDFRTIDSPPSSWVFHDDDKELTCHLLIQNVSQGIF